jgi:plasmid replication initiation protein
MTKLLPIRHPHADFFIADIFDGLPVKDDIASMEHPFFSLSKVKDVRTIQYERAGVKISVSPNAEYGLPTIFDKDVLLYCGSLLMSEFKRLEMNGGGLPSKTLRISTNDLLKTTNRATNDIGYQQVEKALDRLHGVSIKTNIKTGKIEQKEAFHLLESYKFIESHYVKDRRVALEVTVSDWFYNSIIGKEALTISCDYFRLGKSIERRLYEIARKHCGNQNEWRVSMQILYEKSGSTGTLRKFRFYIKEIAKNNHLPDYTLKFFEDADAVLFRNRRVGIQVIEGSPQDLPTILPNTIKKGAVLVEKAGTGWDYQEIRSQFTKELLNGFQPDKVDGAFLNFVKKKIKHPPEVYVAPVTPKTPKKATRKPTAKKLFPKPQTVTSVTAKPESEVIKKVKPDPTPKEKDKPKKKGLFDWLPW